LAASPIHRQSNAEGPGPGEHRAPGPPGTNHLKRVPEERADRERLRNAAFTLASQLDKSRLLARHEMEAHARTILASMNLPEAYVGWTMVALGTGFWHEQVQSIPTSRRLLLLPHCLRDTEACPAEYDEFGLKCQDCGACRLTALRELARQKGYRVLIAEGSPIVMQIILAGHVDAVMGVACLDSLEKALDKILLVGLPSMAVPLLRSTCRHTSTDVDWVREMIDTPYRPGSATTQTQTYVHLLRCAAGMFERDELERLMPRSRGGPSLAESDGQGISELDPLASTELIAYDFLLRGGKHFRPFITLAAYDVMSGSHGAGPDGARSIARLPDAVKRIALAMEVFHKASLVHDDVEDDDPFRYGQPAVHRKYGTSVAINVGDYLIGLGYRLIAAEAESLGADGVADVLARLGEAHTKLCEGQGAELAWREGWSRRLTPLEALKIYALKTAPAFEAALYAGLRMAGPADDHRQAVARFARHLGIAFQILNDLDDWDEDQPNKRHSGTDVLGGRPTVLWALALEGLSPDGRRSLEALLRDPPADDRATLHGVRQLYEEADVYQRAARLVAKHRQRARDTADEIQSDQLRHLLHYFVDAIVPTGKHDVSATGDEG
jgi:geranylgeranyl pyrophosphate synthase